LNYWRAPTKVEGVDWLVDVGVRSGCRSRPVTRTVNASSGAAFPMPARAIIEPNLERLAKFMDSRSDLEWVRPDWGTVAFPRSVDGRDTDSFSERLLREHETAALPARFFGTPPHFRIAFGVNAEKRSNAVSKRFRGCWSGKPALKAARASFLHLRPGPSPCPPARTSRGISNTPVWPPRCVPSVHRPGRARSATSHDRRRLSASLCRH